MSDKISIKELLEGVEVEWKSLNSLVSTVTAPLKVKKSEYQVNGEIPIIDQGQEYIAGYIDEVENYVKSDKYIIFGDHSEHIKYVDFSNVEKLLNVIDRFNQMGESEKELIRLLIARS